MLKLLLSCDCGYKDKVEDINNLDGYCPKCHEHHGNVVYLSNMSKDEFVEELAKMTDNEISKYSYTIQVIAEDIVKNGL